MGCCRHIRLRTSLEKESISQLRESSSLEVGAVVLVFAAHEVDGARKMSILTVTPAICAVREHDEKDHV